MGCRKNLTRLSPAERTAFVNACLALKTSGGFDKYNEIHAMTMDPGGVMVHGMPLFFPWHRRLIRDFERWANKGSRGKLLPGTNPPRRTLLIEEHAEDGGFVQAYRVLHAWVSEFQAVPDLDANANAVAIETMKLEHEGWERDVGPDL